MIFVRSIVLFISNVSGVILGLGILDTHKQFMYAFNMKIIGKALPPVKALLLSSELY